jgi:hypothetical protein
LTVTLRRCFNHCTGKKETAMPRPLRVEYPGAIYHLMSRGDHREAIFRVDADRRAFLTPLGEHLAAHDEGKGLSFVRTDPFKIDLKIQLVKVTGELTKLRDLSLTEGQLGVTATNASQERALPSLRR